MDKEIEPKKRILFVYDHEYPHFWKDGLWAALQLLKKDFDITMLNLRKYNDVTDKSFDFILGWGGFNSPVDRFVCDSPFKKGLCIGGNAFPPDSMYRYDVLFYETDWYRKFIAEHKNARKAFGVNTNIYYPTISDKVFDYISVGAFANWKRQLNILNKYGNSIVVGQIQENNLEESFSIIGPLLQNGVAISNMVMPEQLAVLYNASKICYIPADINGGGERAVLEARACMIPVIVEDDNEKLQELLNGEVPSEEDYYKSLKKGIESVL